MKQHHPLIIAFAKGLSACLRILLSLRYKVEVKGDNVLQSSTPLLVLPNHQALIDPIIIISQIYKRTTVIPVITSGYYDIPVIRNLFREWGAVRVSDLESGSRNTNVLNEITTAVNGGFAMGKNIILYPSGQIAGQGYEKIFNKKSAHNIVSEMPAHVKVVGVRINGLWGSMWSKAWRRRSHRSTCPPGRCRAGSLIQMWTVLPSAGMDAGRPRAAGTRARLETLPFRSRPRSPTLARVQHN